MHTVLQVLYFIISYLHDAPSASMLMRKVCGILVYMHFAFMTRTVRCKLLSRSA